MPKITYIEHNGKEHQVEIPVGYSVMEGAIKNSIPGIDADCGGSCACATCHIWVDEKYLNIMPEIKEAERDMLDFVTGANKASRLSCQIMITNELDGIIVRMPEKQS
ncbi:MAG: 2Fe-2S iron-sulfur cluster binding domain-containing protein [Candidatus Fonsibacter sp.]|nr:2Fe-2S iron-sulfur cluster binding domain-containing protein [Candidatus Fonsibacter sp.]